MPRKIVLAVTAALISVTAVAAAPMQTIPARQNNFKQMGRAQKAIGDELKMGNPDFGLIRTNANTIANLASQLSRWFPRGTGKESGANTGALPAIWQQTARFQSSANQLTNAARGLQRTAAGGDVTQIRSSLSAVGGTCKGCHVTFKGEK